MVRAHPIARMGTRAQGQLLDLPCYAGYDRPSKDSRTFSTQAPHYSRWTLKTQAAVPNLADEKKPEKCLSTLTNTDAHRSSAGHRFCIITRGEERILPQSLTISVDQEFNR